MGFTSDAYQQGYHDALTKVKQLMTSEGGRTESYEATLAFLLKELT